MKHPVFGLFAVVLGAFIVGMAVPARALSGEALRQQAQAITVLVDGLNPGSGVIVAREAGSQRYWVLTAHHVVATEDEYWIVTPDGREHRLDYSKMRSLPRVDLAMVPFESPQHYPVAVLADYPPSQSFPYVFVSGWSGSQIHGIPVTHKFSAGQLLRRRYGLLYSQAPFAHGYGLFYTSITETGMSGGPILDTDGRVIGIHGRSEGTEYDTASDGATARLHWGFSSGMPLPARETLAGLVNQPLTWQWETTRPALPTPDDLIAIRAWLTPSKPVPTDAVGWTNQGNQLYRLEQFDDALLAFQQAIQRQPDFYQAWYGMAQTLTTRGRYSEAMQAYNRVLAINPGFRQALRDRALVWVLMEDYQRAAMDFNQVLAQAPDDYVAWYLQGNLLWRHLGQPVAAINAYDRALTLAPEFAEVWVERGRVLRELGHPEAAIVALENAVQLEPELSMGWYWLAVLQQEQQQPREALAAIAQAILLRPGDVNSLLLKSQLLLETGQVQDARQMLTEILQIDISKS